MIYYYGTKISPHMTDTPEGYLICHDVPLARVGTMEYTARELGLSDYDDVFIEVNRSEDEVFSPAALASFEGKDVTYNHPPENLTPETYAAYSKGHVENVRRSGDYMVGDLHIKDASLISDIKNNIIREISCGYTCDFVETDNGIEQVNIRGNHVAVVPQGRAGRDVAIKDTAEAEKGRKRMSKKTEALLNLFGLAAGEADEKAKAQLVADAAAVLDAEPAEEAQDAEPIADEVVYKEQEGVDLGSKIDRVLDLLEALMKKDEPGEEKVTDEITIDELVAELTGKEDGSAEVIEETIEEEDACKDACVSADAAVTILQSMRPVIASIEDKAVKAAVADALIKAVKQPSQIEAIHEANRTWTTAQDAASRSKYEKTCADQKEAYDALNPHKKTN